MKTLKHWILSLALLFLFASSIFAQNVNVGSVAPSFQLSKFGGGTVSMGDYPGQIILLNFLGSY
jgi:hypothetical protein